MPYSKQEYVIVQHSGYGYGSNPQFQRAVEHREIPTTAKGKPNLKTRTKITNAGGHIVIGYIPAEDLCYKLNYPDAHSGGLIPACYGSFSTKKIDGLRIWIKPDSDHVENTGS